VICGRQRRDRDHRAGNDRRSDECAPERETRSTGTQHARQLEQVREHVDRRRGEPDDEARLVQADERPLRLVEREQRNAGPEQEQGRDDDHRSDEHTQRDVRRTATHVLLPTPVVAQHAPARARELQADRRKQQHSDERVHGQEPAEVQERGALDGQEDDQHPRGRGRQLLVPGAPAGEEASEPVHRGSQPGFPEFAVRAMSFRPPGSRYP
jgi:hypothetical protein